jgi:hypothetical protein
MTVDKYLGSGGGQPRLIIPMMGKFQDPAVEQTMQTILRWANSLLLGGGGITGWFFGTGDGPPDGGAGTQTVWTQAFAGTFVYFDVTNTFIEHLPSNSLTLFLFGWRYFQNGINIAPPHLVFNLTNGAVNIGESANLHYDTGANLVNVDETRVGWAIVDDDSPHSALPYNWLSGNTSSGPEHMSCYLGILSVSKD